jgi:hypothetical protein
VTRRAALFAANMLPVLAWLALRAWAEWTIGAWERAPRNLGPGESVGLQIDNWGMRMIPFAMLAVTVLNPLLSIAIAVAGAVGREPAEEDERRAVRDWWLAALAFSALAVLCSRYVGLHSGLASTWAIFLCHSNALGAAYALQRARHRRGASRWKPRWVLAAGGVLAYAFFPLALLVPPAVWALTRWRAGRGSDQAAQPDEAQHRLAGGA